MKKAVLVAALAAGSSLLVAADTLPSEQARMYPASAEAAWEAVLSVLKEAKLEAETVSVADGVIITKPASAKKNGPPPATLPNFVGRQRISFRIFVPMVVHPARVYVDAVVETKHRVFYEPLTPEAWLLDQLDRKLGQPGYSIPKSDKEREALARELAGNEAANDCGEGSPSLTLPRRIEAAYYAPLYPEPDRLERKQGKMIFVATVQEDGAVQHVETLLDKTSGHGFETAARQAIRLWRYRPARKTDGCPTSVLFQINLDFNLK